jgi:hypothetical protein
MDIPKPILDTYIPNPLHSITNLLQFSTPNIAHDSPNISLDGMLSTAASSFEGHDVSAIIMMITSLIVPPLKFVQAM